MRVRASHTGAALASVLARGKEQGKEAAESGNGGRRRLAAAQ